MGHFKSFSRKSRFPGAFFFQLDFECIFLILLFILYFFIYVDMKINKNNELYLFDREFTKTNLNKEICLKLIRDMKIDFGYEKSFPS